MSSPTQTGYGSAWIEEGVITKVNPDKRVYDWQATHSGRRLFDLPLYAGYQHGKYGEGTIIIPDQGAKCVVCQPSDNSAPFIFSFVSELENKENENGEAVTTAKADERNYGPGDLGFKGRDGNFLYLQRGGLLKLGAKPGCSSTYFPTSNLLHHVCKRNKLDTFAGSVEWEVQDASTQDARYILMARETATDTKASVMIKFGKLSETAPPPGSSGQVLVQFSVAPQSINNKGIPISEVISYIGDKEGNSYSYNKGTITQVVGQNVNITINNNKIETISGNLATNVSGNVTEVITGIKDSSATSQFIKAQTVTSIEAPTCRFGGTSAAQPGVYGPLLISWLATHVHPAPGAPPATAPGLPALIAKRYLYE